MKDAHEPMNTCLLSIATLSLTTQGENSSHGEFPTLLSFLSDKEKDLISESRADPDYHEQHPHVYHILESLGPSRLASATSF